MWNGNLTKLFVFSCESSSRNANVCQSVSQSVCHAYLFVRFTSIFYNSKLDEMKLRLFKIIKEL